MCNLCSYIKKNVAGIPLDMTRPLKKRRELLMVGCNAFVEHF